MTSGAWAYPLLVSCFCRTELHKLIICRVGSVLLDFSYASTSIIGLISTNALVDPSLLQPLLPVLFKGVVMSLAVVAGFFALTYLPQVAVLAFISGPLG